MTKNLRAYLEATPEQRRAMDDFTHGVFSSIMNCLSGAGINKDMPEKYAQEQERVLDLLLDYLALGPAGAFAAKALDASLRESFRAAASGDIVAMLQSLKAMQELSTSYERAADRICKAVPITEP